MVLFDGSRLTGYNNYTARKAVQSRDALMNLPNTLTLARIFLIPLLVVVLLTKFEVQSILGVPK